MCRSRSGGRDGAVGLKTVSLRTRAARLLALLGPELSPQEGHEQGTFQFVPMLASDAALRDDILRRAEGRVELRTYYEPLHRSPAFSAAPRQGG